MNSINPYRSVSHVDFVFYEIYLKTEWPYKNIYLVHSEAQFKLQLGGGGTPLCVI